ncbi:MAG: hypothetical protein AB1585_09020 [Thermodesulfobacteriota bacterium]
MKNGVDDWQDTEAVLTYFSRDRKKAVKKYESFLADGVARGKRPELTGGGLVRSMGGWFEVISQRHKGEGTLGDQRVLGSGEYIQILYSEADRKQKETMRLLSRRVNLDKLSKQLCVREGVREEELLNGKRRPKVVKVRKLFCQLAVNRMSYCGAEVARFLGISTSATNRMAASRELPDFEEISKLF